MKTIQIDAQISYLLLQTVCFAQSRLDEVHNRLIHPIPFSLREVKGIENERIKSAAVRFVDFIKDGQDFSSLDFILAFAELLGSFMTIEYRQRF